MPPRRRRREETSTSPTVDPGGVGAAVATPLREGPGATSDYPGLDPEGQVSACQGVGGVRSTRYTCAVTLKLLLSN